MKILAIVITYYPDKELLEKNIAAFIDDVDKILIWENTPEPEIHDYRFIEHEKVEYCGDGINSISHGLNYGWHYANSNGFDYMLTMDQDSLLENFIMLKEYAVNHFREKMLLGPCINTEPSKCLDEVSMCEAIKVDCLITSGSLVYVGVLDELGGYDERLAIDGIDTDLCLRADKIGIKSYRIKGSNLIQRFGDPESVKIYKKEVVFTSYSAQRLRSILTAHFYLIHKHKNMPNGMKWYIIKHYVFEKLRDIVFFEDEKKDKILSLFWGVMNGLFVKI